ncbi:MAG: PstC family ABC transporter permease, partial [Acidimicrobiales bacterium]
MSVARPAGLPLALRGTPGRRGLSDRIFRTSTLVCAGGVVVVLAAVAAFVLGEAKGPLDHYGVFSFLHTRWAPSEAEAGLADPNPYGIAQFIYGTFVSSAIAMGLAVPISIGVALFITQVCPQRLRTTLITVTELLAAVPSVVYGFWALFALLPALRPVTRLLEGTLGKAPIVGPLF